VVSICLTIQDRSRIDLPDGRTLTPFLECVQALAKAHVELKGEIDLQVVVADWRSTDWPLNEWLDEASGDLPVHLVMLQGGFSRGRGLNVASQYAPGDVLFFLDTDTLLDAEVVRAGLRAVQSGNAFFPLCWYYVEPESAIWAERGFGNCMVSRDMLRRVGLWPVLPNNDSEDVLFHDALSKHFEISRPRMKTLVHPWHPSNRPAMFINSLLVEGTITGEQYEEALERAGYGCPTRALLDLGVIDSATWMQPYTEGDSSTDRFRFAFVTDVPEWAIHRAAVGIREWHGSEHTVDVFTINPWTVPLDDLPHYDLIRFGCASNFIQFAANDTVPQGPKNLVSIASFWDVPRYGKALAHLLQHVAAFGLLDKRLVRHVFQFGVPNVHVPDRADPKLFYPQPELRPKKGPLRIGWTGSEAIWPEIKHVNEIREACAEVGVEFVRQDREHEGPLDTAALREWYNKLDVYIAANNVDTPTPVPTLEAASCGVLITSTRCGELWPVLAAHEPHAIIEAPTKEEIVQTLRRLKSLGRQRVHQSGAEFLMRYGAGFLTWEGEARRVVEDMAALVESVRG
jgi:hypothetical protein